MPVALKRFQQLLSDGLVARFMARKVQYDALRVASADETQVERARRADAIVVLQAPTGSGKTIIAIDSLAAFSREERMLWFWFAPFAGVVEQARQAIAVQAPQLRLLDLLVDRRLDALVPGGVFVTTWQSVAAGSDVARKARDKRDGAASLATLLEQVRADGYRIGCVVDEAHHGFAGRTATEAKRFFAETLRPDYALLMTATPRDEDATRFAQATGYVIGPPDDWATVARIDGVDAGLLKRGVKIVRYVARNDDERQLIDFESAALGDCVAMHRRMAATLARQGLRVTPLMLVQVPDDESRRVARGEATRQEQVRRRLVQAHGFDEVAVRVHTAKEPDADIVALAQDPTVEVLIFKMAVALGFDAPRAFTLAALRVARAADFGVQVVGRLMRVDRRLQGRAGLPPELDYGYVFLANTEAQEGLLEAGSLINAIETHAPEIGTQTVVTISGATPLVQIAKSGESLALFFDRDASTIGADLAPAASGTDAAPSLASFGAAGTGSLFSELAGAAVDASAIAHGDRRVDLLDALARDAGTRVNVPLSATMPARLVTEYAPPLPGDFEMQLAAAVALSPQVLAAHQREWAEVERETTGMFAKERVGETSHESMLARLDPVALAVRANRQVGMFEGVDERRLFAALTDRLVRALAAQGIKAPDDPEELDRRLDLVLVRNPGLLADAYRRCRLDLVTTREIELPRVLSSEVRLRDARRGSYGVFPAGLNGDERTLAEKLDASSNVAWWHRNAPARDENSSVALLRWDEGARFFPDFIAAIEGRRTRDGIVLVELKGNHLWGKESEARKADAVHPDYGRVVVVGRNPGDRRLWELVRDGNKLAPRAPFEVESLRFAGI